jgi:hypothetical protein
VVVAEVHANFEWQQLAESGRLYVAAYGHNQPFEDGGTI